MPTIGETSVPIDRHDEGGRDWGRIASLIESARINGANLHAYLKATLEALARSHPASRIDELVPSNFPPASSGACHRLCARHYYNCIIWERSARQSS
jgi:hypothetical protein